MTPAKITKIIDSGVRYVDGQSLPFQTLELTITGGDKIGQIIKLDQSATPQMQLSQYGLGEKVFLDQSTVQVTPDQSITSWVIADYNRQEPLLVLSFLFVAMVILVGKWRGFWSLVALSLSFLIITFVTVPLLASGWNAIAISILTAAIILPINFYLSHGWQLKTHLAIISTILALVLTSLLAQIFIQAAHLTGLASEEAGFLMVEKPGLINLQSLILAAVIVGALGILDDVTVSQTSVVFELKTANPSFGWRELYLRGMRIGQDHISSMVNTLILVYAGAALPLLLLFSHNLKPIGEIVNLEIISEEIIKTLSGSIGLIFAAPLATIIATLALTQLKLSQITSATKSHSHHH